MAICSRLEKAVRESSVLEAIMKKLALGGWGLCMGVAVMLSILCTSAHAVDVGTGWAVSLYGARLTDGDLGETISFDAGFEDAYLVGVALSKRIYRWRQWFQFELEAQVAKHFDEQDHWEFNGLLVARWLAFPWDRYLDTSLAVGNGISYATETPEIEAKNHDETAKLLDYLMFELAFDVPRSDHWTVFTRLHHRSGAYGLFDGVHGASNAWAFGVRYHF